METAAVAHAAEIGWLKAHVRLGRSYPLVAVRVCRRASPHGGVIQVLEGEDHVVLRTAAFAITVAQRLDLLSVGITTLELDASLLDGGSGVVLKLKLAIDSPADAIDDAQVAELAQVVLAEGSAAGKWEFGGPVAIEVELASDEPLPLLDSQRADATAAEPGAETPLAADAVPPQPSSWRFAVIMAVFLGVCALALVAITPNGLQLSPVAQQRATEVAAPAVQALPTPALKAAPTAAPTSAPTVEPTAAATAQPTAAPTLRPTAAPTSAPTAMPVTRPTAVPVAQPTAEFATATPVLDVAGARTTNVPPPSSDVAQPPLLDFVPDRSAGLTWPNNPVGVAWFDTDGYHLAARTPGRFVAIGVLSSHSVPDLLVTATFRKVAGPTGGGYGLIIGDQSSLKLDGDNQEGSYAVFEVGDKGEVGAWRRDQDHWVDILGWTPSDAVRGGTGENALAVSVSGPRFSFTVNGVQVQLPADAYVNAGGVGVFLGGDGNEAVVSQIAVSRLN